jgi:endonuclease/exonuclease/phosphatase family metal-dependent hydrolase
MGAKNTAQLGVNVRFFRVGRLLLVICFLLIWGLMNVSKPGQQVHGCLQDCAVSAESNGRTLNILSLNILHDYPAMTALPERLDLIATQINDLAVDIALLQEVPNSHKYGDSAAYLAELTGMNHAYFRANGNRRLVGFEEGVVILSRYPLDDVSFVELEPQAGFFENRVVLRATAVTPAGELDLYVTHLTNGDTAVNLAQAESLLEFVTQTRQHTAVIAGDLNARPESSQIKMLSSNWIDAYRTAHPNEAIVTCCIDEIRSSQMDMLEQQLDYIFLAPAQAKTMLEDTHLVMERPFSTPDGPLWASDHVGLLVTLMFAADKVNGRDSHSNQNASPTNCQQTQFHHTQRHCLLRYGRISTTTPGSAQLNKCCAFSVLTNTQPYVT